MAIVNTAFSLPLDPHAVQTAGLEAAFQRFGDALFRYFVVRTGDREQANDLMQQLWLIAVRRGCGIPLEEIEFWLRGVARNLVRTAWRNARRRPVHAPLASGVARRLVNETLPSEVLERSEVRDRLLLALTELSAEQQDLIIGHYFRGRSLADLGAEAGLSERAVEGRLYRARAALRDALQEPQ